MPGQLYFPAFKHVSEEAKAEHMYRVERDSLAANEARRRKAKKAKAEADKKPRTTKAAVPWFR